MAMGRPKRPIESLMVDMPLKVLPETAQEIECLALRLERSKSFISRKLVLRGLAAYMRDGNLDEPENNKKPIHDESLPTNIVSLPTDQHPQQYPTTPRIKNKAKGGKK